MMCDICISCQKNQTPKAKRQIQHVIASSFLKHDTSEPGIKADMMKYNSLSIKVIMEMIQRLFKRDTPNVIDHVISYL